MPVYPRDNETYIPIEEREKKHIRRYGQLFNIVKAFEKHRMVGSFSRDR